MRDTIESERMLFQVFGAKETVQVLALGALNAGGEIASKVVQRSYPSPVLQDSLVLAQIGVALVTIVFIAVKTIRLMQSIRGPSKPPEQEPDEGD